MKYKIDMSYLIQEEINSIILINEYLDFAKNYIAEGAVKRDVSIWDIKKAINNKNYVGIYYEESDSSEEVLSGFRLIEPYVYGKGYTHIDGNVVYPEREYMRVYVIMDTTKDEIVGKKFKKEKGGSRKSVSLSKRAIGWRLIRVDRIQTWQNFDRKFEKIRPLYHANDKHINNIIVNV